MAVNVDDAAKSAYKSIQDGSLRFATFKVQNDNEVILVKTGERDGTYDQFLEVLMEGGPNECRYGVYDFGDPELRKLFVLWYPETVSAHNSKIHIEFASGLREALASPNNPSEMRAVGAREEFDLLEETILEKM